MARPPRPQRRRRDRRARRGRRASVLAGVLARSATSPALHTAAQATFRDRPTKALLLALLDAAEPLEPATVTAAVTSATPLTEQRQRTLFSHRIDPHVAADVLPAALANGAHPDALLAVPNIEPRAFTAAAAAITARIGAHTRGLHAGNLTTALTRAARGRINTPAVRAALTRLLTAWSDPTAPANEANRAIHEIVDTLSGPAAPQPTTPQPAAAASAPTGVVALKPAARLRLTRSTRPADHAALVTWAAARTGTLEAADVAAALLTNPSLARDHVDALLDTLDRTPANFDRLSEPFLAPAVRARTGDTDFALRAYRIAPAALINSLGWTPLGGPHAAATVILDLPWDLVRSLVSSFGHRANNPSPDQRRAGEVLTVVTRAVADTFGDDLGAWPVLARLGAQFTGTVRELLDTTAAILHSDPSPDPRCEA